MPNQRHRIIFVDLLRARQDGDHVARLRSLLLASACAAACFESRALVKQCAALHSVRVSIIIGHFVR